jgi:hypothetical protein
VWDPVIVFGQTAIAGGSGTAVSWTIRDQIHTGSSLAVSTTQCGNTSPDLCGPFFTEAYAQFTPDSIWDLPSMPIAQSTVTLGDTDPGDPFVGANEVLLLGMDLAQPAGSWPASYTDPRITWRDHDADGSLGVTSFVRKTDTSNPDTSDSCGMPYAYLPNPDNPLGMRIATADIGSRMLATYDGALIDCNTLSGSVTGPGPTGFPLLNGHARGCTLENGSACSASTVTALDEQGQQASQRVVGARFSMVRVSPSVSCATVRGMTFP